MEFIIVAIVVIVVIALIAWIVGMSNALNQVQVKIDEADSDIDVALQKRFDLLTKELQVTKSYAKYEKETILETIKLRQGMNVQERQDIVKQLDAASSQINVVAEAYPQLNSDKVFVELQRSARDAEDHLQAARRFYNSNVSAFNQMLVTFPNSIIANQKQLKARDMFEANPENKKDVDLTID